MTAYGGLVWKSDRRDAVKAQVQAQAVLALNDALEHLKGEANKTVPWEEGTLERSATVAVDEGALVGAVSYGGEASAYAVRQHEETGWQHKGNRRAKWLELTWREQAGKIGRWLADTLQGAFK